MKKLLFQVLLPFFVTTAVAQNVGVGTTTPNASAMLEINAGNKGLLIPQVPLTDTKDITTIPAAANSLLIYNRSTAGSGGAAVTPGFYFWDNISATWIKLIAANNNPAAWLLTGNINTAAPTNFIGNTDNQSLLFKINNNNAGFLGTTGNTYWGLKSGNINNTGTSNVAVGSAALAQNINRSNLVAVGDSALYNNGNGVTTTLDATGNTAVGSKALYSNAIGSGNTASGFQSLYLNSNGINNTAQGYQSLYSNSSGVYNTAQGYQSLFLNSTGINNTAIGYQALYANDANDNVAMGSYALSSNITGVENLATGFAALSLNTTGNYNTASGSASLIKTVHLVMHRCRITVPVRLIRLVVTRHSTGTQTVIVMLPWG
jgi:trimeric autotransporter adhesin